MTSLRRRIATSAEFEAAVAALGSPSATHLIRALLRHVADHPTCAPSLNASNIRVLRTRSYADYPALCLYYTFDEETVEPLHVEPFDELRIALSASGVATRVVD